MLGGILMFKKLGKKVLPIIMATMLVASMTAVSVSAATTDVESSSWINFPIPPEEPTQNPTGDCTIDEPIITEDYYKEPQTGLYLRSDNLDMRTIGVFGSMAEINQYASMGQFIRHYNFQVFSNDANELDFEEYDVRLEIPCYDDSCYVLYKANNSDELVQLEAEDYGDGYSVRMPGSGDYILTDRPLAEGEGELIEQTLVDETTGISVKGMIPTGSSLGVVDLGEAILDYVRDQYGNITISEEDYALLQKIDCYMLFVVRNLNVAATQGELTVSFPNENEGFEVRHIYDFPDDSQLGGSISSAIEIIANELDTPTMSDEELANEINSLIDSIMPAIASEYVDGNYVVNEENPGYFIIAPQGSVYATAEDVKQMRDEYASAEKPTEMPTDTPDSTETPTDSQTQAPTQASTNAPTQAQQTNTNSTTQDKGAVNTAGSSNIPMLLAIIGLATSAMVTFKKRIAK